MGDTKEGFYIGREARDDELDKPLHGKNQWPNLQWPNMSDWKETMVGNTR